VTQNSTEPHPPITLAIDAGSPLVSAALGEAGEVLAEVQAFVRRSSRDLIRMIDEVLSAGGLSVGEWGGVVALRGPGSFTGLRVGLATCLGLHQALEIPATTLTTFETLASAAPESDLTSIAAVETIRQSWLVQTFRAGEAPGPLDRPRVVSTEELAAERADLIIGFGLAKLQEATESAFGSAILEPPPLAGQALVLQRRKPGQWDPSGLVRPLYLQAPVAALPGAAAE